MLTLLLANATPSAIFQRAIRINGGTTQTKKGAQIHQSNAPIKPTNQIHQSATHSTTTTSKITHTHTPQMGRRPRYHSRSDAPGNGCGWSIFAWRCSMWTRSTHAHVARYIRVSTDIYRCIYMLHTHTQHTQHTHTHTTQRAYTAHALCHPSPPPYHTRLDHRCVLGAS